MNLTDKKLNILIIAYIIPYPADDGGKICTFSFIDKLRNVNDFTVIFTLYSEQDEENVKILQAIWDNVKIRTIKLFDHQPTENTYSLTSELKRHIKQTIKYFSSSKAVQPPLYDIIENHHKTTPFLPKQRKFIEELHLLVNESPYDIIQLDFTDNLNLVNLLPKNAKKVFVEIESRYSILNDNVTLKKNKTAFDEYVVSNTKTLEITYLKKFDAIFCLSDNEVARLQSVLPQSLIFSSPFSVPDDNIKALDISSSKVEKLVFIGPEYHHPNGDGIYWFIENVLEKMNLNIPLYVIGVWNEESINKFKVNKNIIFTGFVNNIDPYLKNSIMVVPIRLGGGGLRTKILIAMAQGAPVVSTSIGADGFNFKHGENFLLADGAEAFYTNIKHLMDNEDDCFRIALNAQNLFKEKYSQNATSTLRNTLYHKISDNPI